MEVVEVSSIEEYVSVVGSMEYGTLFRGISKERYKLLPSLGRLKGKYEETDILKRENRSFEQLRAQTFAHGDYRNLNEIDFLVLLQHHALPTRLLDWTLNSLVALFFSVRNCDDSEDSAVYTLSFQRTMNRSADRSGIIGRAKDISELGTSFCKYIGPHITPRMSAQSGYFTLHTNPFKPISNNYLGHKIIINKNKKHEIYKKLCALGVHEYSMFPDLDGLMSFQTRIHLS